MPFSQYSREYTKTLTDSRGEPWKRVGWGYGQIEGQKNTQDWVVQRNYNWTPTRLYSRNSLEDEEPDRIPADLVHHFLLAICSRPGIEICFKDRGWYPREQDAVAVVTKDDGPDSPAARGSQIHNKILSNILKTLKVNEDQELAVKIMSACPELVAGYWPAAALTLDPRISSRWLVNIAFFRTVISLPVPTSSLLLTEDSPNGSYQPTPPPLRLSTSSSRISSPPLTPRPASPKACNQPSAWSNTAAPLPISNA